MAQKSDLVIHGYVGDKKVVTDDLGRLITITSIEVIDGLLGAKTGQVITIEQLGGEKDGVVMPVLGGQSYQFGQELIFFGLKLDSSFVSFGAGQGKLDIIKQAGEQIIKEDLGDVSTLVTGRSGRIGTGYSDPLIYNNLDLLKSEIRNMIKAKSN